MFTYWAILEGFNGYYISIVKNMRFFCLQMYNISFYLFKTPYKYLGKQTCILLYTFLHIIYIVVILYVLFLTFYKYTLCIHVAVSTQTTSYIYLGGMVFNNFPSPDFKISILICCF